MSERFQVDLRGIIDLAANHLYSSPEVFVREVIQNAVDAVTARRQLEPGHAGAVRLELTPTEGGAGTLCITDDGIGLTTAEVHTFLSTVGGSSKRSDAEAAAERAAEERGGFLGRFGIGLLSCFMVTEEIVVVTRSAREAGAPAVEWRGRADGSYSVRELPESRIAAGTRVYLAAKEGAEGYFDRDLLLELAKRYAEMLPIHIVVSCGGDDLPVNRPIPPWEMPEGDGVALGDYCHQGLGFRPIDSFRIEAAAGEVAGYAFIRPDRASAWGRVHRLYSQGMFVSDEVHGLMPQWATFIGCVLNAKGLRLTASRESVHHDDALERSGEQLGSAVRRRLAHLLRNDPARFAAVMGVHDTEIRGLAVKDRDFFDLIVDLLEFDTTMGRIRFGEFRREHDRLLVARTPEQFRRLSGVAAAAGLRVFNGGYTYHEELLSRAAERHPELELRSFDSADLIDHLPEPADAGAFSTLLEAAGEAMEGRGCEAVVREFEPANVPALFALGLDAEFHRQLDRTKSMSSGLWNEILDAMAPRPERLSPTRLCFNARSPLVRRIAGLRDASLQRTGVRVLFVQALMSGQHPLTGDELALLNRGMEDLLGRVAGAER